MTTIISNTIVPVILKAKNAFCSHFSIRKEYLLSNRSIPLYEVRENLMNGMEFGLFGRKADCYFENGTKTTYETLWKAISKIHDLVPGHGKTLYHICPHKFIGITEHKFSKRRWRKMIAVMAPCEYLIL